MDRDTIMSVEATASEVEERAGELRTLLSGARVDLETQELIRRIERDCRRLRIKASMTMELAAA